MKLFIKEIISNNNLLIKTIGMKKYNRQIKKCKNYSHNRYNMKHKNKNNINKFNCNK